MQFSIVHTLSPFGAKEPKRNKVPCEDGKSRCLTKLKSFCRDFNLQCTSVRRYLVFLFLLQMFNQMVCFWVGDLM